MTIPAIELKGIRKAYLGNEVLKDVTLCLEPGQFCALIGKNGVGKSTLMRLLVRQERPSAGEGWVLGHALETDPPSFNEDVGYVSESIDYALPVSLQVFFSHYGHAFQRWDKDLFGFIMGKMGISMNTYFRSLSRGQRMHVAFAAAVAAQPKLLVLDEITAVLDANARAYFMSLLGDFVKKGGTVLLATNIITEVQHYADRLIMLHQGTIKLNLMMKEIPRTFVKLRRPRGANHPVFQNAECVEVTLNSDGSLSYVLPMSKLSEYSLPDTFGDKRGITAEEIFIYFTRSRYQ